MHEAARAVRVPETTTSATQAAPRTTAVRLDAGFTDRALDGQFLALRTRLGVVEERRGQVQSEVGQRLGPVGDLAELSARGRDEDALPMPFVWIRRHDEYA